MGVAVAANMGDHPITFQFYDPRVGVFLNNTNIRVNNFNATTGDASWKLDPARHGFNQSSLTDGNMTGFFYHVIEVDGRLIVTGRQTHVDWVMNGTFEGRSVDGFTFEGNWSATAEPIVQPTFPPGTLPTSTSGPKR